MQPFVTGVCKSDVESDVPSKCVSAAFCLLSLLEYDHQTDSESRMICLFHHTHFESWVELYQCAATERFHHFSAPLLSPPSLSLYFMGDASESEEYEDSDSESEDPFTSHQARRQTASGSQRGAMAPFYNYPGAGWTPPFSSAPPLPWVTQTHRHKDRQTDRTCWERRSRRRLLLGTNL